MSFNPLEWVFYTICAIGAIHFLVEYWPRTREQEFSRKYRQLQEDWRRRGLTPAQQRQEMNFRTSWARLRRLATEATLANPTGYTEAIAEIGKAETKFLAEFDKDTAKRFLKVVNEAPLSDILYPDAMDIIHRDSVAVARQARAEIREISDDLMAAVTRK